MNNSASLTIRSPIQKKLLAFIILIGLGLTAFLLFFHYSLSTNLEKEKKDQSKHITEVGLGVVQHFYQLSADGNLTSSQAKARALNTLNGATYGANGYLWVNSGEGVLLMQPYTPNRVGLNLINWTDFKGKYFFKEFISTAKNGGGWVSYYWPKPNIPEESPKISYVTYFTPWDWVLGTGLYLDDMQENIFWIVFKTSVIFSACFIVFVVIAIFVINYFLRQIGELAIKDTLTNLYTKRFLKEILPTILTKLHQDNEKLLAVIDLDIDHFKKINANYGRSCGDRVLKRLANIIIENTRPNDFSIRFGGEEFLLIGFFNNEKEIIQITEIIRTETDCLVFDERNEKFHITISAGIAIYRAEEELFETTLKRAGKKLQEAKESGRNRICL
ncbi:cache domain-containing protein [Desulfotalea psychrophila]|uniref:diguanylate cyclase n=1 Tax=Desulfotalea psychrophila (strain LSv54 / DSM 12343) TaxID=177439 RepID=Q6APX9_DESPS|nr:cache domain-containing protein [Desulfotalea psychrophila]CAG35594.1 probable methyl-accepting chemotaxis protein [Desulfotalea psychrophila LSv54]